MLCAYPFRTDSGEFGCGQCLPCRINRKSMWTARIMMELAAHSHNQWVTLTYSDEFLPENGSLNPRDLKLFLMRLRKEIGPFRYFAVGEYGERLGRPHYHAFLFGVHPCHQKAVIEKWGKGLCYFAPDPNNGNAAQYTAGYTVKKWTKKDAEGLAGRHPEFTRMSLKPPIGSPYLENMAASITANKHVVQSLWDQGDVPGCVRLNGKLLPLGRTMVRRLRLAVGKSADLPEDVKESRSTAFLLMQQDDRLRRERERKRSAGVQKAKARQKIYRRNVL